MRGLLNVLGILSLALAALIAPGASTVQAAPACFPGFTTYCIDGRFLDYWSTHGGLAINGYPLSDTFQERLEDGNVYIVQYFERVRMEYHPEIPDPQYQVLLGQFGRRILKADLGREADPPAPRLSEGEYDPVTQHNFGPHFLVYWQTNGDLAQFGRPLTEPFRQTLENGQEYEVQYFERARFEWHPEQADPQYKVLLGQFGRRILATAQSATPGFEPRQYIGRGDRYNCSDFRSQAEAQAVLRADPTDPNKLDVGGVRGVACENNPPPYDRTPVPR